MKTKEYFSNQNGWISKTIWIFVCLLFVAYIATQVFAEPVYQDTLQAVSYQAFHTDEGNVLQEIDKIESVKAIVENEEMRN